MGEGLMKPPSSPLSLRSSWWLLGEGECQLNSEIFSPGPPQAAHVPSRWPYIHAQIGSLKGLSALKKNTNNKTKIQLQKFSRTHGDKGYGWREWGINLIKTSCACMQFSQKEQGERERTDGLLFSSSVEAADAETEKWLLKVLQIHHERPPPPDLVFFLISQADLEF